MVFTSKPGRGNQGQSNGNRPTNEPYINSSPSRAMTGPIHPQQGPEGYYPQNPYGNSYQNPYFDPRLNNPGMNDPRFHDPRYQQDPRLNPYGTQHMPQDPHYNQSAPQQNQFAQMPNPGQNQRQTGRTDDLKGLSFWREEDENGYYDNPEEQSEKGSQLKFLIIIAGLVIVSGILWLGYRFATHSESQAIPLIPAEQGPYKRRPENPGGMAFPHQEMLVYGRLSPDQQGGQPVERIMPEQEQYYMPEQQTQNQMYPDQQQGISSQPMVQQMPDSSQNQYPAQQNYQAVQEPNVHYQQQQQQQQQHPIYTEQQQQMPAAPMQNQPQGQQAAVPQAPEQKQLTPSPAATPSIQPVQQTTETPKKAAAVENTKVEAKKAEKTPEVKAEKVKEKKAIQPAETVKATLDAGFYMQLASLPTEASAKKELTRLRQKHKDLSLFIQPFEAGVKKYHRVVVGPFSDRDVALKKCINVGNGCKVINITGSNG